MLQKSELQKAITNDTIAVFIEAHFNETEMNLGWVYTY